MRWQSALIVGLIVVVTGSAGSRSAVGQSDPMIAAAGDIACEPSDPVTPTTCRQRFTSDLLVGRPLAAVLLLGDNQYEVGALDAYMRSYDPTWGRVKSITRPAPGNHEYYTPGATGYYAYFGAAAGDPTKGYYSFNIGNWHIIALNSNCADIGGCDFGSPQEQWLYNDLNALPAGMCKLAYWHHARFSSGPHGSDATYDAFWSDLYAFGADIVLVGHDHNYERFAPQDPDALPDPSGIRQFVVGTGGKSHYGFVGDEPNTEVRNSDTFGVLLLTLRPTGYAWQFVPEAGKTFTDSGTGTCH